MRIPYVKHIVRAHSFTGSLDHPAGHDAAGVVIVRDSHLFVRTAQQLNGAPMKCFQFSVSVYLKDTGRERARARVANERTHPAITRFRYARNYLL